MLMMAERGVIGYTVRAVYMCIYIAVFMCYS